MHAGIDAGFVACIALLACPLVLHQVHWFAGDAHACSDEPTQTGQVSRISLRGGRRVLHEAAPRETDAEVQQDQTETEDQIDTYVRTW